MHRPHHCIPLGDGEGVGHAGNTEVRHLHMAVGVDQHVLGLDVPVDDAVVVGVLQRA